MTFRSTHMQRRLHQFTKSGLLILALFMIPSAYAADFKAGQEAYDIKDYVTALREYRPLAEQGHAEAQYSLGSMYFLGKGLATDHKKAVKWYTLAAEQGYSAAQALLGAMYREELGVAQDYKQALKWTTLAADQEHETAQYDLGFMYASGQGVNQDYKQAIKWYTLSAEQGYSIAQHNLGGMYNKGEGIPQDYEIAFKWYTLAAEQGYSRAQHVLGNMYLQGNGVPKDSKKAVKWYTLAAQQGDSGLQYNLGVLYNNGQRIPQNIKQAIKWFTLSAEQGYSDSQSSLGAYYYSGKHIPIDYKQALKWYTLAAKLGGPRGTNGLSLLQDKSFDWHPKGRDALSVVVNLEESIKTNITGQVGFSKGGNRNMYFQIERDKFECFITKDSAEPSTDIWYFNKQAVKMSSWCKTYSNSEEHYLSLTPQSKRGSQFVVSAFRKAASSVDITTDSLSFKMSAKGFTKVWDSISSEAL